jgi:cell division septal protein FtsQ
VKGNQQIAAEEIQQKLQSFIGQNLLALDLSEAGSKLTGDKRIAKLEISRAWPHSIIVQVTEKEPVVVLQTGKEWGLTEDGEILPFDSSWAILPMVKGIKSTSFKSYSRPYSPELWQVLDVYRAIEEKNVEFLQLISEVLVNGKGEITLKLLTQNTTIILGKQDLEQKIARLMEMLVTEENLAATIDLRFENMGLVRVQKLQGS